MIDAARATNALGALLTGAPYFGVQLSAKELSKYDRRGFLHGWRVGVGFSSGRRDLEILVDAAFPWAPPRIALSDPPSPLTWPHVEHDGVLCLLLPDAAVSAEDPVAVTQRILELARFLVEDCIAGRNEIDFQDEFLSYWVAGQGEISPTIVSVIAVRGPTRIVRVWRGSTTYLVGDDDATVLQWLTRRYGPKDDRVTSGVLLLWMAAPPLPNEYPQDAADLVALIRAQGPDAMPLFDLVSTSHPEKVVVLLAAPTSNGPILAGAIMVLSSTRHLNDGFRPGKTPPEVLSRRVVAGAKVTRLPVERADAEWIHGRGRNEGLATLRRKTVAVVGCGSIGAPVAMAMVQAGVGSMLLVDPESLSRANTGRHPLGAASAGENKAEALASHITRNYPHMVEVAAHNGRIEELLTRSPEQLGSVDLIVSTTGSWTADGMLGSWHLRIGRPMPIVFGWMEARACAAHATAILSTGGCLRCGFLPNGVPRLRVTDWPAETVLREPGCGATFQPYEAAEAAHAIALVAELGLECLGGGIRTSTHRMWAARQSLLERACGRWTREWLRVSGSTAAGGVLVEVPWQQLEECPQCATPSR